MRKIFKIITLLIAVAFINGCQNMNRPELGDYLKDANPAGGPLKFYAAFDGTSSDVLKNAVDSIRANFASSNTATSVDGISGKAVQGGVAKFVSYAKPNDFGKTASSFTISFWQKHDGQTKNNALCSDYNRIAILNFLSHTVTVIFWQYASACFSTFHAAHTWTNR